MPGDLLERVEQEATLHAALMCGGDAHGTALIGGAIHNISNGSNAAAWGGQAVVGTGLVVRRSTLGPVPRWASANGG